MRWLFFKTIMRYSKLIIFIAILLIAAGSVIIYYDQSRGKTRICEYRIRQACRITCTWKPKEGKKQTWTLNIEDNPALFIDLQKAMLADLRTERKEASSEEVPEYRLNLKDLDETYSFEIRIYTGPKARIECGEGTYENLGNTTTFLEDKDNETMLRLLLSTDK